MVNLNGKNVDSIIEFNGTKCTSGTFNNLLAWWNTDVKWETSKYAYAGEKEVYVMLSHPPVDVDVTIVVGNGNNGNEWARKTVTIPASTNTNVSIVLSTKTVGLNYTVVAKVTAKVLGTTVTVGKEDLTDSILRGYQIGTNKNGTMGKVNI